MPKRNLRIVSQRAMDTIGACEVCNMQFKSYLPQPDKAEWEIRTRFVEHKCKLLDESQNALRVAREATEN
jgi:hypothetical protein